MSDVLILVFIIGNTILARLLMLAIGMCFTFAKVFREVSVYFEIVVHTMPIADMLDKDPAAIILPRSSP